MKLWKNVNEASRVGRNNLDTCERVMALYEPLRMLISQSSWYTYSAINQQNFGNHGPLIRVSIETIFKQRFHFINFEKRSVGDAEENI